MIASASECMLAIAYLGDIASLRDVFRRYFPQISLFTSTLVHDESIAQDIAVDTFIKYLLACPELEGEHNIRAFLHTTARNNCLAYLQFGKKPACGAAHNRRLALMAALKGVLFLPKVEQEYIPGYDIRAVQFSETDRIEIFREMVYQGMNPGLIAAQREDLTIEQVHNVYRDITDLLKHLLQGCGLQEN